MLRMQNKLCLNTVEQKSLIFTVKNKVKKHPFLYGLVRFILNPGIRFYPAKRNRFLRELLQSKKGTILNIGSGTIKIPGPHVVINIDIIAFRGISTVCDAHNLPFHSERFEAVMLENCLEHLADPGQVIKEAYRVLKNNGLLFVEVPFLYEFHSSPSDYYRFTLPGLELFLKDFEKVDSGISAGPTGTLNAVIRNYLAIIFSFGSLTVYEFLNMFFGIFTFPLKFLDFILIRFKNSSNIASIIYFIGKKRDS